MKKCIVCKEVKPFSEFNPRKKSKDGYNNKCKKCISDYNKKYRKANKEKIKLNNKKYNEEHKEDISAKNKKYQQEHKEENKERCKTYREEHKEELREKKRVYLNHKYKTDEYYRMKKNLKRRAQLAFESFSETGKMMKSEKDLIDYEGIIKKLGPCPGDRKDYHMDHIFPLCAFDFNDLEQVRLAFAPENYQWLTKKENKVKGTTYDLEAFLRYIGKK